MFEMKIKRQDGREETMDVSRAELMRIIENSLEAMAEKSAIIECEECGEKFLVNTQDLHQVTRCHRHRRR